MKPRAVLVVAVLAAAPASASAQTLNGVAEWTVANGGNASDGQDSGNNSFWQLYTVGYSTPILDPRLMKVNSEFSFRSNTLTLTGDQPAQNGRQSDVGYKLGASLFPNRPFPVFFQTSRDSVDESGDYPTSSGIRSGIVTVPDTRLPDFRTINKSLTFGGQLNLPSWPRLELGYRSGSSVLSGGPYDAEQHDEDLHASLYKETARTRQTLRYQRTSFSNLVSQSFNQRLDDLDYEFGATLNGRSRVTVHTGRRQSFSLFDLPSRIVDSGTAAYQPPSLGAVDTTYVTTGLTYQPSTRLALDLSASADRSLAGSTATSARLAMLTARYDLWQGLSVSATGTYGTRGQIVGDTPITVMTRSGLAGVTYRAGRRWLEGTVGANRGAGLNTTLDGRPGSTANWSAQATLSSTIRSVTLGAGVEQAHGTDAILDYGNYNEQRRRASIQQQLGRFLVSGSLDDAVIDRGRDATLVRSEQRTFTSTATYRLGRDAAVNASAGGFTNHTGVDRDHTMFAGGGWDARVGRYLHLNAWIRREYAEASQTRLQQATFAWLGSAEYRLRLFLLALEYRHNDQDLEYVGLSQPFAYRGHQLRFRATRKFSLAL